MNIKLLNLYQQANKQASEEFLKKLTPIERTIIKALGSNWTKQFTLNEFRKLNAECDRKLNVTENSSITDTQTSFQDYHVSHKQLAYSIFFFKTKHFLIKITKDKKKQEFVITIYIWKKPFNQLNPVVIDEN